MTCLDQCYVKHMIMYLLVACLFQVGGGRAAPDPQTISVEVPDTSYMESIMDGLSKMSARARSMANGVASAYTNTTDMATKSGQKMMSLLSRFNNSAVSLGTDTANRMGQMVKNGGRSWLGLMSGIFSSE